jgi:hypothetical protein
MVIGRLRGQVFNESSARILRPLDDVLWVEVLVLYLLRVEYTVYMNVMHHMTG